MSRRTHNKQDSLELLLDTICNTFGGVLFIAILVVLLLRQSDSHLRPEPISEISAAEFEQLSHKLSTLTAELERRRQNAASQQTLLDKFATPELRELAQRKQQLAADESQLRTTVDDLLASNAALIAAVQSLEAEINALPGQLESARQQREAEQAQLQADRKSRTREAKLPVLKPSGRKQEIGLVVQYGRLYLWHRYDAFNVRLGLNTDDFVITGEKDGALLTSPKPNHGIQLDGSEQSRQQIRTLITRFNPRTCYLTPIVRPDSFAEFRLFRDFAIELGYEYRLMPTGFDTGVRDRGGSAAGVQ